MLVLYCKCTNKFMLFQAVKNGFQVWKQRTKILDKILIYKDNVAVDCF